MTPVNQTRHFVEEKGTLPDFYSENDVKKYMNLHRLIAQNEKGMSPEEANQIRPESIRVIRLKPTNSPQTGPNLPNRSKLINLTIAIDNIKNPCDDDLDLYCYE